MVFFSTMSAFPMRWPNLIFIDLWTLQIKFKIDLFLTPFNQTYKLVTTKNLHEMLTNKLIRYFNLEYRMPFDLWKIHRIHLISHSYESNVVVSLKYDSTKIECINNFCSSFTKRRYCKVHNLKNKVALFENKWFDKAALLC